MKKIITILLITIITLSVTGCSQTSESNLLEETSNIELDESTISENDELYGAKAAENDSEYTLEEMLQYSLEDERLALAEYEAIINTFDITTPFTNIIKAEAKHEASILGLYGTYNLEIPEFDATQHVIIPETLQETYEIGVQAEIDNIAMYNSFLEQVLDDTVRTVFENLRDASESHLATFEKHASK
jgi:rubrerythrin